MRPDGGWWLITLTVLLCGGIGLAIIYGSYRQMRTAILFEDTRQGIRALVGFFIGTGFIIVPVMAASSL